MQPVSQKFRLVRLLISLSITLAIGMVASIVTRPQIAGWYSTLKKPSFNPPPWLFAPVWIAIYTMIAIAAYLVWQQRSRRPIYQTTRNIYILQLCLNFLWSIMFFGFHQVFGALVIIILLWISIIFNIALFRKFSKAAGWLLLPYLLWVSFAGVLNAAIYLLNT